MELNKKVKLDEKQFFGYTNDSNPFNDNSLTKTFIWGSNVNQKLSSQVIEGELEIVRKRRQEREREKERIQEMRMREFQSRDQDNYDDWLKKEQEFHDDQDKKRAILRIEQERYQPVDYMIQAILVYKNKLKQPNDIQYMKNPELIIKSLTQEELQTCLIQSEQQQSEEKSPTYKQIWKYFIDLIKNKLDNKLTQEDDSDIENLIKEKNVEQLTQLEQEIYQTYNHQSFKIDVEYWEKILSKIRYQRAKQFLNQFYLEFDAIQDKQIIVNKSDKQQIEIQQGNAYG